MKKALTPLICAFVTSSVLNAETTPANATVAFVRVNVSAKSDYALGVPLHRPVAFEGAIQSISGNTITVAGTTGWTANEFNYVAGSQPNTYYVRIDTGTKEGLFAKIVSNTASSITVTPEVGDVLTGILTNAANKAGDLLSIIPYWTPGTLLGGVASGTQLLLYSATTPGINLPPVATYAFSGSNWTQGTVNVNDVTLEPGQGIVLRNNSSSPVSLALAGDVPMVGNRLLLKTLAANTQQDFHFFYNSPVAEILGNAGLGLSVGDQLLVTDNTAAGINKVPSQTLTWNGTAWLQAVPNANAAWLQVSTNASNTFAFQPGTSYILRKNKTGMPQTFVWSSLQSYLAP